MKRIVYIVMAVLAVLPVVAPSFVDTLTNNRRALGGVGPGNNTEGAKRCSNVLLLSPGRTATDTVSHTIIKCARRCLKCCPLHTLNVFLSYSHA